MKPLLASLWKRRWCRIVGVGLVLCALLLLNPFIRQSAFGPQINGTPWCVWEDDFRWAAHQDQSPPGWFRAMLEKIGLLQSREFRAVGGDFETRLPLYLHLAEDNDPKVRANALHFLVSSPPQCPEETLPVFRRHLEDRDLHCRIAAARGVWYIAKEAEIKSALLPLLQQSDVAIRNKAASLLAEVAEGAPELFPLMATLAENTDPGLRVAGVMSMQHFGKRGIPILRKSLSDPGQKYPIEAVYAAMGLGKNGAELIPDLLALQNHASENIRSGVSHALYRMDPKQFPRPANWVD